MEALVTGATGFIGPHLVNRLLADGTAVRALVRPGTDASWLEAGGAEIVRGDVRDPDALRKATRGCEIVFHLAGRTSHGNHPESEMYSINVDGTSNVARAVADEGVGRLVHASTARVYGVVRNHAITERTGLRPDSPYSDSKARAEQVLRDEHSRSGLPVVMARITSVFGAGSMSWHHLFLSIATGRFRPIGSCDNYYHPADVDDIVDGLALCGRADGVDGDTFILAGPEPLKLREMLTLIAEEVGGPPIKRPLPGAPLVAYAAFANAARRLGIRRLPRLDRVEFFRPDRIYDLTHARDTIGYAPEVGAREAIGRLAKWYREQGLVPAGQASGEALREP
jgi:nucleoside-diphosphate-sugar epimerase